jgi:GntR family transcriptional repressor for pyruvate dehydrogenase complex
LSDIGQSHTQSVNTEPEGSTIVTRGFEPVKRVALTDAVVEQLHDLIASGELKMGDRLPSESELAFQLDVGRSTIREALRALSAIGLVSRTKRGTFVSEAMSGRLVETLTRGHLVKQTQLADLLEARQVLEVTVAFLAAQRATEEDIEKMASVYRGMLASVDDVGTFIKCDTDFHLAVAEAAQNDVLVRMLTVVRELLLEAMAEVFATDPSIRARAMEFHSRILRAIIAEDPEGARAAMTEHLDDVWRVTGPGAGSGPRPM